MAIAGATPHYSAVLRGAVETTKNNRRTIPRHARVCAAVTFCLATAIAQIAAGATPGATLRDDAVVFTQADLRGLGVTQTQQVLTTVIAAMTAPSPAVAGGTDHVRPTALRGMAPDHLVVLVNGRRRHDSAQLHIADTYGRGSTAVDLDMIPLSAVERVEITGGGVARHGSGAIAGVVNFVLSQATQGAHLDVSYGHFRTQLDEVPEISPIATPGPPLLFAESGDRNPDDGDGDTLTLQGSAGFPVGDAGFIRLSAQYRTVDPSNRAGFDQRQQYPLRPDGSFDPRELGFDRLNQRYGAAEITDLNLFAHVGVTVADWAMVYGWFGYGSRQGQSAGLYRRALDPVNVPEIHPDGFLPLRNSDIDDLAIAFGARGNLRGWDWDANFNLGEDEIDWSVENTLNASMGTFSPTRFRTGNNESRHKIFTFTLDKVFPAAASLRPADVSLGFEYAVEAYEIEPGDLNSYANGGVLDPGGLPRQSGAQGFAGYRQVDDFDEGRNRGALWGVLRVRPINDVAVTLTARVDDYDAIGAIASFELAAHWDVGRNWRLRAVAGSGFRAPTLAQTHFTATRLELRPAPTTVGMLSVEHPAALVLGSTALDEERSVNLSVGVTFQPFADLQIALDAYQIEVDDRILLSDELTGPAVRGALAAAGFPDFDQVYFFVNGADSRTRGADLAATYRFALPWGNLRLSAALNMNEHDIVGRADTGFATSSLAERAIENGIADSKIIATLDWQYGRFGTTARLTGHGKTVDPGSWQELDPTWMLDVQFSYALDERWRLAVGVQNLTDTYPDARPRDTAPSKILPYSNYSPFGFNGKFAYLRATLSGGSQ